jgi:hypothetical protein
MRPRDTSPEAWAVYIGLIRRMSPAERMAIATSMMESGNHTAEAGVRRRFPEADDREVFLRRVQLMIGKELFRKAYGLEYS